ncbi:MAG: DUF3127 domain-containing protein [Bacteroidales bacterium]|nr:DUF3127 domain-containing protein [Bacteroidales bacterium]
MNTERNNSNGPYAYTGEIVDVGEVQSFGTKGFTKREVILCPDQTATYPSYLQIVLKKDATSLIMPQDKGKTVTVKFFVETRKWTSKTTGKSGFSTEASAFKVLWPNGGSSAPSAASDAPDCSAVEDEDLPF